MTCSKRSCGSGLVRSVNASGEPLPALPSTESRGDLRESLIQSSRRALGPRRPLAWPACPDAGPSD